MKLICVGCRKGISASTYALAPSGWPERAAPRLLLLMAAVCLGIAISASTKVTAQVAPANRSALLAEGFSQAELTAAATTQIGSNYSLYDRWLRCATEAGNIILANGLSATSANNFSVSGCDNESLRLRAAVARSLGLARASRVVAVLKADFALRLQSRWNARHAGEPTDLVHVGVWSIQTMENRACLAMTTLNGGTGTIALIGHQGAVTLLLQTDYPQPEQGSVSPNHVIIGHYPAPSPMQGPFVVVNIVNRTWIAAKVNADELRYLHLGGSILIQDVKHPTVVEERSTDPTFPSALDAVQRC